jgi:hypothetical protein
VHRQIVDGLGQHRQRQIVGVAVDSIPEHATRVAYAWHGRVRSWRRRVAVRDPHRFGQWH